ncbi:MAG: ring-cleaving dioxygenase [Chthoniobacterales bacterium]
MSTDPVRGLHHVTAIAGPAQENLDFYAGILGMRLVKKSVNQDDPGTYHLFYADAVGSPGSDLTFFPWSEMAPSRQGWGLSTEVSLVVPPDSLTFWSDRLNRYQVTPAAAEERFGRRVLPFRDVHGLGVALVESADATNRSFEPWEGSPVPIEHQIRGLESARLVERDLVTTTRFLTETMKFHEIGTENGWHRYGVGGGSSGRYLDVREEPTAPRGAWGTGSIHHLAWRVDDEAHQLNVRDQVIGGGAHPTPVIDRFWFKSVYFKEPGGVLFELATDGPGFAVDEDPKHLGEVLVLPPWLEKNRGEIESVLPRLKPPA